MNDRELLELAAKAAGMQLEWGIVEGGKRIQPSTKCFHRNKHGIRNEWKPIADDGDALRLHVFCCQTYGTEYIERFNEELLRNPSYATAGFRRAATVTAAEIGKEMEVGV